LPDRVPAVLAHGLGKVEGEGVVDDDDVAGDEGEAAARLGASLLADRRLREEMDSRVSAEQHPQPGGGLAARRSRGGAPDGPTGEGVGGACVHPREHAPIVLI
jgi:hypothetical protein